MPNPDSAPLTFHQFLAAPFQDISVDRASGFIRGNFFFLLWIVFVPLLLFGMKQGWELLYGLFDDSGAYPGLRAASMLFVYFLLAMAIWLLPLPFFQKKINAAEQTGDFKTTLNRLRPVTADNPYRGLLVSAIPMVLYGLVMLWVQAMRGFAAWQWALTLATVVGGVFFMYWVMERLTLKIRAVQFWIVMNWVLMFLLILVGKEARSAFWNYCFVGVCTLIQLALIGRLLKLLEADFQKGQLRDHRRYYCVVFLGVVLGTIGFSLVNNLNFVTPTFVLLLITTFYLMLNDLIIALYVFQKSKWIKYGLTVLLLAFGWFVLVRPSRLHDINYVAAPEISADGRVDFNTYFEKWYTTNIAPGLNPNDTTDIPIFLVAAQGGGSRAGLWTSQVLNRLETESDFRFHRHLFAVTSASGGSAGTGATLALWRYLQDHPEIDTATRRQLCDRFASGMFSRNYLSSQFMQLFVNETAKRFYRLFDDDVYGRNYEHQRHEVLGFANAIRYGYEMTNAGELSPFERIRSSFKNGVNDSLLIGKGRPSIVNYPMQPYLSYWYSAPKQPDTRLPLYFPITTNIQTGRSGYASPLAWEPNFFVDAIDIIGVAEKADASKPGRSLAMVTATNLSQLFPAMNGYTYIEGVGNFMDGGLFENMGLPLMRSIYTRLDSAIAAADFIPPNVKNRLKIKVLFLINDRLAPQDNSEHQPMNQSIATFNAVGFSSIQGTSAWWQSYFKNDLLRDDPPVEFVLQNHDTPERDRVPLGRWLSNRSVETVCARAKEQPVRKALGPLGK